MIKYNRTIWQKNTQLNPNLFNNMENGIADCVEKLNKIGEWAEVQEKPKYTASEVGAMSAEVIQLHDMDGSAHNYLFTHHSHKPNSIEGLEEYLVKIDEMKQTISTLKASVTKLTNRVKELEEKVKE